MPAWRWRTRRTRLFATAEAIGPLHGLPTAFKDLEPAVGFPQSKGSPLFKTFMPEADSVLVERIRRAGAIPIGKTNVPEFGMGSQTYNTVYGTTLNPYDRSKTAGGSSGGAAVALATGMLPIADGGDLGGSLRNPANFNNIVALRPSVGLVPVAPSPIPFVGVSTKGAMARSVARRRVRLERDRRRRCARPAIVGIGSAVVQRRRSIAIGAARVSPGRSISAACRSIGASGRCSTRSARPSRTSAASSKTRVRISATSTRSSSRFARGRAGRPTRICSRSIDRSSSPTPCGTSNRART